ncbi:MAG: DUF721 domain-containing protein [Pseudomonadota bacterium]
MPVHTPPRLRRPVHDTVNTKSAVRCAPTVGLASGRIVGRLGKKFGFADPELLKKWPEIVGDVVAKLARPEKLARRGGAGVLTLRARHGAAAAQLQHVAPQILECVNRHYGYKAVASLKITQG